MSFRPPSQYKLHSTLSSQVTQPRTLFAPGLSRFSQCHTLRTPTLGLDPIRQHAICPSPLTLPAVHSDHTPWVPRLPTTHCLFQGHDVLIFTAKPGQGSMPSAATHLKGTTGPGVLEQQLHPAHCPLLHQEGLAGYPHVCQPCTQCSREKGS